MGQRRPRPYAVSRPYNPSPGYSCSRYHRRPQRTWKHYNYFMFFWAVSFNPNQWNTGSSLVSSGLVYSPSQVPCYKEHRFTGLANTKTSSGGKQPSPWQLVT